MNHPFLLTPTLNWIEGERAGWWAPCIWCGFGVATLVGGEVIPHTGLGAEGEPLRIAVENGSPMDQNDLWVHFAIPPARAWKNVHEHCAMVLPFRTSQEIDNWSERHALPRGEAVPLDRVAELAKIWYGSHASPEWRKWTVVEAQQIFFAGRIDQLLLAPRGRTTQPFLKTLQLLTLEQHDTFPSLGNVETEHGSVPLTPGVMIDPQQDKTELSALKEN